MRQAALRYLLGGVPAPPPLGRTLWATLGGLLLGSLSLTFDAELWPHTPVAARVGGMATSVAALLALPQLLWWARAWLQAYTGPNWLRLLLTLGLLGVAVPALLGWLVGMGCWLVMLVTLS